MSTPPQPQSRIACPTAGCLATFARMSDMVRHQNEVHKDKKYCVLPECPYPGAKRAARVRKHAEKKHPHLFNGTNQTAHQRPNTKPVLTILA